MTIRKAFLREAQRVSNDIREQDQALQQEEEELRQKLNDIEEVRAQFRQKDARLNSYRSLKSEDPCPMCWLSEGVTRECVPTGEDERGNDIFRCSHCRSEIVVKE